MLTPYPQYDPARKFTADVDQYEVVLRCSQAARSLVSEYGIREGGAVYIHTTDPSTHSIASEHLASIQTLSGKSISSVKVLLPTDSTPSTDCAIFVISTSLSVLLDVSNKVSDKAAEIQKLQPKFVYFFNLYGVYRLPALLKSLPCHYFL
ncbi:MAG: hypothetical protein Q9160_002763 [Pyrenula sp. 1 TL-2023]